ncbi:MAG: tetratricopeptide repeat protein [Deltaproteobacteria bacterium]|nr:tetratricopeptide repeat protein [Deltaproteobacteria bacterium]
MKSCRKARSAAFIFYLLFCSVSFAQDAKRPAFTDLGQFNYANFLLGSREYSSAVREFSRLIENYPGSPLLPEAQFRLGESYFNSGRYKDAASEFGRFISNYPSSPFAPVAKTLLEDSKQKAAVARLPVIALKDADTGGAEGFLRAAQVTFFEAKNSGELDGELKRLKAHGVNTVIVRVFHNKDDRFYPLASPKDTRGVYFKTTHAPVVDDLLSTIVSLSHKHGLKVFAWMTTRYADYGVEDDASADCEAYDLKNSVYARCKGLDLFNEKNIRRLEGIYSDLAACAIDGVLFQDDLVLRYNEGFGPHMQARFRKETGLFINPKDLYSTAPDSPSVQYTSLFWRWAAWKNKRLLEVAGRLRSVVKKRRPDAKFAVNLMYESITNPASALAWLSQDLNAAVKAGFDYYSIMAYHRQMEEELEKGGHEVRGLIREMAEGAAKTVGDPKRVLIKLQTIDWKTGEPLSNSEVVSLIRTLRSTSGVSLAVVPYRSDFPFFELGAAGAAAR